MTRGKKRTTAKAKKSAAKPAVAKAEAPKVAEKAVWHKRLPGMESYNQTRQQAKMLLPERQPVSGAPTIFVRSLRVLLNDWKLFAVILVIYAILHLLLVGGVTGGSGALASVKLSGTHSNVVSHGVAIFSTLVGTSNTSSTGGVYETFLFLIMSVVIIWALRQVYAHNSVRARDAFYKGTFPLIQFILILLLIGVETLPLVFGVGLYNYLVSGGVARGPWEILAVLIGFFVLFAASVYMLCSSTMALYIVTLPDMTPMEALKNARELVQYRRWIVLRKLLFLPVLLLLIGAVILIPIAIYIASLALFVLLLLSVLALAVVHSYMYALYRELL